MPVPGIIWRQNVAHNTHFSGHTIKKYDGSHGRDSHNKSLSLSHQPFLPLSYNKSVHILHLSSHKLFEYSPLSENEVHISLPDQRLPVLYSLKEFFHWSKTVVFHRVLQPSALIPAHDWKLIRPRYSQIYYFSKKA